EHSLFARRLVSVTTRGVALGDAHGAPLFRAGTGVPFPRARALSGICLTRNVIGRRTGTRGVDEISARRLRGTGRAPVGSTGISSRGGIPLRRAIGWGSSADVWHRTGVT